MITFTNLGKQGRLGNQLFQCAATIALAIRNNDKYLFPPWDYAPHFNLHGCFSNSIQPTITYNEPHFHYAPIPHRDTINATVDLVGFYQSIKYFEDCQDTIQHLLTPKIGFGIKYGYTAIHIRRGDYLTLTREYIQLGMDYYQKAMEIAKTNQYIIFSDDIPWCKANFTGNNVIFSEGRSPIEDLALMASCENQIVCNSTFGWWSAYLNKLPTKIVVAPARWFGPALSHNTRDLLPSSWKQI